MLLFRNSLFIAHADGVADFDVRIGHVSAHFVPQMLQKTAHDGVSAVRVDAKEMPPAFPAKALRLAQDPAAQTRPRRLVRHGDAVDHDRVFFRAFPFAVELPICFFGFRTALQ